MTRQSQQFDATEQDEICLYIKNVSVHQISMYMYMYQSDQ